MPGLDRLPLRRSQAYPRLAAQLGGVEGLTSQRIEAVAGTRVRIQGKWVLNFASSSYLGLDHDASVRAAIAASGWTWGSSLAMPRLLAVDTLTERLEAALAELVGREAALVFPSTLHAAIDVLSLLAGPSGLILVDAHAYPISVTAANVAAGSHGKILRFRHDDPRELERLIARCPRARDVVVVCDGVYPALGLPASLREIGRVAKAVDGQVYIDDAHGLGVLGAASSRDMPYGSGGGGSLLHSGASPNNVAYVSSLSKAFGIPLAFVAGPSSFINYLRLTSSSVVHSSPPALPLLGAALTTLRFHDRHGDDLRRQMLDGVRRFRHGVRQLGLSVTTPSEFPIQSIGFTSPTAAVTIGRALRRRGIWPVLALGPEENPTGASLRFIITARHSAADIDEALNALVETAGCVSCSRW